MDYLNNLFSKKFYPPYFKLKIIIKMSMYSTIIKMYNPKAIISYVESSFTSQVMTDWLEEKGIKHINIMHGEKLYFIADSYSHFSEFYVWDIYYKELMIKMKADPNQFFIEKPESLVTKINLYEKVDYDITYYLSDENSHDLKRIRDLLIKMKNKGYVCKVRIHPRGNNGKQVNKIFKDFFIENSDTTSLKKSFETTKFICSLNSTVLYEGYLISKKVIIDDITRPDKYHQLKELGYIMLNKKHLLISEMI